MTLEKLLQDALDYARLCREIKAFTGGEQDDSLRTAADYLRSNGVTVQEWIPVTERLPEKDVDVLVFNGHGFFVAQFYTWYIGRIGLDCWSMPQYCADPTHWMPLPQPPKEEA